MERVAELSSSHKSSEPQLDAVGDAWSPGGAVGSELMPQVLGSAGWKGALWAPPPVAESPPGSCSGLGASAAGDTGQGIPPWHAG